MSAQPARVQLPLALTGMWGLDGAQALVGCFDLSSVGECLSCAKAQGAEQPLRERGDSQNMENAPGGGFCKGKPTRTRGRSTQRQQRPLPGAEDRQHSMSGVLAMRLPGMSPATSHAGHSNDKAVSWPLCPAPNSSRPSRVACKALVGMLMCFPSLPAAIWAQPLSILLGFTWGNILHVHRLGFVIARASTAQGTL